MPRVLPQRLALAAADALSINICLRRPSRSFRESSFGTYGHANSVGPWHQSQIMITMRFPHAAKGYHPNILIIRIFLRLDSACLLR